MVTNRLNVFASDETMSNAHNWLLPGSVATPLAPSTPSPVDKESGMLVSVAPVSEFSVYNFGGVPD
jgi:hypothetical protein